jgi:hypothetical protein
MNRLWMVMHIFRIYLSRPVLSLIINSIYWIYNWKYWKIVKSKKRRILLTIHSERSIETIIERFKWKKDNFRDWVPWVSTIINNDFVDDCDGSAKLAKWLFKKIEIRSNIITLYSGKNAHEVCVTKDKLVFVSNGQLIRLSGKKPWKEEILFIFDKKYDNVIINNFGL